MKYGKKEIYELLDSKGIEYRAVEHEAVFTMEGVDALGLPEDGLVAKNLFLRDGKKKNFFLCVIAGEARVDLKALGALIGVKGMSFAPGHCLEEIMDLYAGAVTPLGVLNDEERKVQVYIDERFRGEMIGVHPNDNTASIWLSCGDLEDLIREHGNTLEYKPFQAVLSE